MPRMEPPETGFKIRMYRQGHGDCFLMATKDEDEKPFYVLIDCGLKSGSEVFKSQTVDKIIEDIAEATENFIDVLMITHEHEDHVNGFGAKRRNDQETPYFDPIKVGEVWLAWTENGDDDDANQLRERFKDTLFGLEAARQKLTGMTGRDAKELRETLEELLDFEGDVAELEQFFQSYREDFQSRHGLLGSRSRKPKMGRSRIAFKKAMQYMRRKVAEKDIRFLDPERKTPHRFKNVPGVLVYPLGPPRDEDLLLSLDPEGDEEFKFALSGGDRSLLGAYGGDVAPPKSAARGPFDQRYGYNIEDKDKLPEEHKDYFRTAYGWSKSKYHGPSWRRIDLDWLMSAQDLALRLEDEVNNTSLVVAIELPRTKKVLLFTGDAQRGSWISWSDLSWERPGGETVTARELLGRTVLHKISHHGSHNGTLKGKVSDDYANLSWLARNEFEDEYVAMIPSNEVWAKGKSRPWKHPLQSLEEALMEKANGRVLMTNRKYGPKFPKKPADASNARWATFKANTHLEDLFIEYTVPD